jgi:hypothetical protein
VAALDQLLRDQLDRILVLAQQAVGAFITKLA